MSAPTPYDREYDFTSYQASAPATPLPGSHVDAELNRVKASLDSLAANLALIQRDDGDVANESIGLDQLAAEVTVGFNIATLWLTATAYTTSDFVFNGQKYYHCLVAHTSGTFATDLAAAKWLLLVDFSALVSASTVTPGIIQIATNAEALAEAVTNKALVPSNLGALGSTTSFAGLIQLASDAEAIAAAANNRAVTPSNLAALTAANLTALKASNAAAIAAASTSVLLTPANLAALDATNLAALKATSAQAAAQSVSTVFLTPSNLPSLSWGGSRNIARANGGFEVWQRGAGGSASIAQAASLTAYAADRWYLTTGANQASVVDQIAGIADASQFAARIRRNAAQTGTTAMKFGYPLDSDEVFATRNGILALSFTVKAGANWSPASGTLSYVVALGTGAVAKRGAGFTTETTPVSGSVNLTPGGAAQRVTIVAAAAAAATSTQGEIQFSWTPVGTAGAADDFTVDDLQLEVVPSASSLATPFERTKFEECMAMCLRHFSKTFEYGTAPAQNIGTGVNSGEFRMGLFLAGAVIKAQYNWYTFPVPMRTIPVVTGYNPSAANAQVRNLTAGGDHSSTNSGTTVSSKGVQISSTGNAGGAIGDAAGLHLSIDAGI